MSSHRPDRRRFLLAAAAVALTFVLVSPLRGAAASTPSDVVGQFQERLLSVWRDSENSTVQQRFLDLEEPVRTAFDLEAMIRVATGSAWNKADEADREALLTAFTRYSVASWASRFDTYNGQTFQTLGTRPGPGERVIVETRIVPLNSAPVSLDYVVESASETPQIVDVVAKGVSELARLRSDYRSTLKSEGVRGLADRVNELAENLLAE